jgi:hypothetical protein
MITRRGLVQGLLAAVIVFSQTLWGETLPSHYFFDITSYDIELGRGMIPDPVTGPIDAVIRCSGSGGEIEIVFLAVGAVLPNNFTHPAQPGSPGWSGRIYASRDAYAWFVDVLRNEKCTAQLFANPADPAANRIRVSGIRAGWGHAE